MGPFYTKQKKNVCPSVAPLAWDNYRHDRHVDEKNLILGKSSQMTALGLVRLKKMTPGLFDMYPGSKNTQKYMFRPEVGLTKQFQTIGLCQFLLKM